MGERERGREGPPLRVQSPLIAEDRFYLEIGVAMPHVGCESRT